MVIVPPSDVVKSRICSAYGYSREKPFPESADYGKVHPTWLVCMVLRGMRRLFKQPGRASGAEKMIGRRARQTLVAPWSGGLQIGGSEGTLDKGAFVSLRLRRSRGRYLRRM